MQFFKNPPTAQWPELAQRPELSYEELIPTVSALMDEVRKTGDATLFRMAAEFDGASLTDLRVTAEEWEEVPADPALEAAIRLAAANIRRFHEPQRAADYDIETLPGVRCSRRTLPIERVGLYIPGGTAPLFSTLLMLAIPAQLAGCAEIVVCTPPGKNGTVHPAILMAARQLGIRRVYKAGGAGAIAAMAWGTETIPRVDKIFGPGNRFVTAAKLVAGSRGIAIDMPAGASELAVLADRSCIPAFVAADLLSQAEHGVDSQVLLLSDDHAVIGAVQQALQLQLAQLPRRSIAAAALANSRALLFDSLTEALSFLDFYAPEHLILATADCSRQAESIRNAGSVFLGNYAPESAGDYASGTNHALPTGGAARAWSGISVASFQKTISFQQLSPEGLAAIARTVETMATAEGLDAHAAAVRIRTSTTSLSYEAIQTGTNPAPEYSGA